MYKCSTPYESASKAKIGILITNLGTPDSPTKGSLKTYLKEFLSDTRVVEPPPARWIWKLILNVIILNIRPKKSAQAYETVWGEFGEGSPLLDISKQQKELLQQDLEQKYPNVYQVELGMRYGNPSIKSALQALEKSGCEKLMILPLYPQYASATTGSTFDAVSDEIKTWRKVPELKFISHYYNDQRYIDALASSFQSRFGREEWMRDYTDETLKSLPKKDIKNVQIICPGFSADCLETIEEIEEENKDYFIEAGGESYQYIPALNTREDHIACLSGIVYDKTKDWSDQ